MSLTALISKMPIHPDYHGMQVWNGELHTQNPGFGKESYSFGSTTAALGKELPAAVNSTVQVGSQFVALSMTAGAINVAEKAFGIKEPEQVSSTTAPRERAPAMAGPAMNMAPKPPSFDSVS